MGAVPHDGRPGDERPAEYPPVRPDGPVPDATGGAPHSVSNVAAALPAAPVQHAPSPPRRPGPARTHRWGLGAYVLAEAVFLGVSAGLGLLLREPGEPVTAAELAIMLIAPTVLAAGTALLITWRRGNGPRIDLRLEWSWRDVGLGIAFGISGLVLTIPASLVYISIVGPEATSAVGEAIGDMRSGLVLALVILFAIVVVAPLCEEILYRGLLWGGIEQRAGRWWALGVSTLLFAVAHFEFERIPLLFIVAIPIAAARFYTGRLLASIVAHQINNLLPGVVAALGLLGVVPMA